MALIMSITHDPVVIANGFISKSKFDLTLMQVLKLSYIAHGFKLAMHKYPFSNELVEAWDYGPVFPKIYYAFKSNPPGKIKCLGKQLRYDDNDFESRNFNENEIEIIESVYDTYGSLDGWELSALTHAAGTPWHEFYKKGIKGISIPNDVIQKHFESKIENLSS